MGRRLKAKITMPDAPGQLLKLFQLVDSFGGVIDQVKHTRNTSHVDWDRTIVTIEARMSCLAATTALKAELQELYHKENVEFPTESLIPK